MKIAFWSNSYEKSGVSSNLAAISVASVIRYPYSVAVLENHISCHNLGWAYLGTNHPSFYHEVGTNYYEGGGIEGLLRKIYRGNIDSNILNTYLKEIIHKHLYYLPQSGVIHSELFDYEFSHNSDTLFHLLEERVDISFVDTAHNILSSKMILEEADIIVVNLCQNYHYLEDFFENYSSLISKSIFLISNYSGKTFISCRKISKLFDIPSEIISPIPNNELFQEACLRGSVVEFITSNFMCTKENPNYLFIQAIRKATGMIIKKAELSGALSRKEIYRCVR